MTLIDTTFGRGAAKAILAQAKRPIVRIVLTHAHQDHVGGLDALAAELPDAEVLMSARDAKLMAGDNSPEPGEPAGDKIRGYGADTKPTRTIAPGERVGSLEVVAAPGHTPGQLAFLDTRDRTLFAADAYTTLGGVATTAKPNPRFPLPALSTWHRPTALETAQRPARARPGPPRGRPRQDRREPRRARWTRPIGRAQSYARETLKPRSSRGSARQDRLRRRPSRPLPALRCATASSGQDDSRSSTARWRARGRLQRTRPQLDPAAVEPFAR